MRTGVHYSVPWILQALCFFFVLQGDTTSSIMGQAPLPPLPSLITSLIWVPGQMWGFSHQGWRHIIPCNVLTTAMTRIFRELRQRTHLWIKVWEEHYDEQRPGKMEAVLHLCRSKNLSIQEHQFLLLKFQRDQAKVLWIVPLCLYASILPKSHFRPVKVCKLHSCSQMTRFHQVFL